MIISFMLTEDMEAQLSVFDLTVKVLKLVEAEGVKGYNEVVLNAGDLNAGRILLYYQLDAEEFTATRRMLVLR